MVKKVVLCIPVIVFIYIHAEAQNLQLHYDMGKGRGYLTSTVEMFRPDRLGSTFFFIDMDYNTGDVKGISMAYWEIARAFKIGQSPYSLHAEYNGGFFQYEPGRSFQIDDSWLGGLERSWDSPGFTRGITLQALYKYIREKHNASFQLTSVWYWNFFGNKLSFCGFADWWREDSYFNEGVTKFVFQAEPQLWYNVTGNFALGTEIEVGVNFAGLKGLHFMPTAGLKATF
jgi:hypothetical protein